MFSAAFVVGKETQEENGADTELTHVQTHAHTCPDRHTDTPRQAHGFVL